MPPVLPILDGSAAGWISSAQRTMSGAELTTRAVRAAGDLAVAGTREGSRVAVGPGVDALTRVILLLGADTLGAATLLVEPTWSDREREAILEDVRPDVVIENLPETRSRHHAPPPPMGDPGTYFYLPTTSGSSGRPRVMVRSRGSWLESFAAFDVGLREDDTMLVPGPLSSSLFLFATVHALHAGAGVRLLERWSAQEAAEACRAATVVHLVPPMLTSLLSVIERAPDLRAWCSLRTVICGGARVDTAVRERLHRVLPGCELIEYYGSAEHSVVALRHGDGPLRPARGVEVQVRTGDAEVPRGEAGELWVRSALTFDGHLSSGTIRPREPGLSSVGDRAIHHGDGSLTVLGRAVSSVASGARVVAAEEVEAVLRAATGVLDVVVTATPHTRLGSLVTAVVEPDPHVAPHLSELRRRAREELEPAKRPRRWLVASLSRTPSGKPARAHIAEQVASGTLAGEVLA